MLIITLMACCMRRARDGELPVERARNAPDAVRKFPGLDEPGTLGRLTEEQRDALMTAVAVQHETPPNPEGTNQWRPVGPFNGPTNVPGPLRISHVRNRLARSYLEEGVMLLHVRERKTLKETAEQLGYSYRHVVDTWAGMKRRALSEEGAFQQNTSIRDFVLEHLEKVIADASERVEQNAAYGMLVIRACEALWKLEGLEGGSDSGVNIEELAERVRERTPLLLAALEHLSNGHE